MKEAIRLAFYLFLVLLAATLPANAGRLRDGLSAFKRHNYEAAGKFLYAPAAQGASSAQAVLCFMYTFGRGVPQNYREAANWCRRAANQGNSEGQYMLGLMYNKGQGVPEDFFLAYKWLNLAAARASGNKRDHFYRIRDSVATKLTPAQIDVAQRVALDWMPTFEQNKELSRSMLK
jgi:TPR repeat protein